MPAQVTTPYYVSDDARMIGQFIENDWSLPHKKVKKPIVFYTPDYDMDSFDYSQGETLCFVTADDIKKIPKGIGFDGYNQTRVIRIRLRSRSNEDMLKITDEIERIMSDHAINPGNNWNLLYDVVDSPIYPFRKFVQRDLSLTLQCFWKARRLPTA